MVETAERKALTQGLEHLNENMTTMAELSVLAIRKAVLSLGKAANGEVDEVFTLDQEIYGLKQQIEHSCIELIALYAPVAADLRTITVSLGITTDLDRIGRYSKDIAEAARKLAGVAQNLETVGNLSRMGELTIEMIETAVNAFVERTADPVLDIVHHDDVVDALHEEIFQELVDRMSDHTIDPRIGAQYVLINRYFERLSDHAVNIGLDVIYMVTGRRLVKPKREPTTAPSIPGPPDHTDLK
jgi:phosphate transport system protein